MKDFQALQIKSTRAKEKIDIKINEELKTRLLQFSLHLLLSTAREIIISPTAEFVTVQFTKK